MKRGGLLCLLAGLVALLSCGVGPALCGFIVAAGCDGVAQDDSQWLSVMRGPDLIPTMPKPSIYQYWLSQRNVYVTQAQAQVFITSVWPLPAEFTTTVDGLVLALYYNLNGQRQVLRVLLKDAKNCFYDVLIPQNAPTEYVIQRTFCTTTEFRKIVPDSNVDMRDVRNILLISFDKIVVLSADNLQQVAFAKIPDGNLSVASLVDASYQRNHGYDDQLFVVRGANTTGQLAPSEIINYRVNVSKQGVELTFGHFTYLQGDSNTMFINDKSTHLFWTQVLMNQDWGVKEGVLFDYGLQSPHSFRFGAIPFGPDPSARWGAHAFSSFSEVDAMMITSTDTSSPIGFTIQAVYLNESSPSLRFIDELVVNSSALPSLGQSISVTATNPDFAVVMASRTATSQLCLQLFLHCPFGSQSECWF